MEGITALLLHYLWGRGADVGCLCQCHGMDAECLNGMEQSDSFYRGRHPDPDVVQLPIAETQFQFIHINLGSDIGYHTSIIGSLVAGVIVCV